ncbi:MAG: metallophosphoesterase [Abditibacteriota bacterium]|nr:metallophosphoesterase [Abditibacteriota bacterium]
MNAIKILCVLAVCAMCIPAMGADIKAGPATLFKINSPSKDYSAAARAKIIQENIDKVLLSAEVPALRLEERPDKSMVLWSGNFKIGDVLKEDAAKNGVTVAEEGANWIKAIKAAYGNYVNKNLKFILSSDIHNCHIEWYGVSTDIRMRQWVKAITMEQNRGKTDALFLVGDYALDYWFNGGSYNKGTSNTKAFFDKYVKALPNAIPVYPVAGNHEQYTNAKWKEITGFDRFYTVNMGNCMFIMLDAFADELGPDYDHDGKYVNHNVAYIKSMLAKYPAKNVFLVSHWFEKSKESDEFKQLVASEPRIRCMFCGHDHNYQVDITGDEWGNKPIIHTGEFSYAGAVEAKDDVCWGYRVLRVGMDGTVSTEYVVPAHNVLPDGTRKLVPEKTLGKWSKKY